MAHHVYTLDRYLDTAAWQDALWIVHCSVVPDCEVFLSGLLMFVVPQGQVNYWLDEKAHGY